MSLPSWECGLKSEISSNLKNPIAVTPFVGVWIEITAVAAMYSQELVTPFVGVWIEIHHKDLH